MKRGALLALVLAVLAGCTSQAPQPPLEETQLTGNWQGTLTQQPGGSTTLYEYNLTLYQDGLVVNGTSIVRNATSTAHKAVTGHLDGGTLYLTETKVLAQTDAAMTWCLINAELRLLHLTSARIPTLAGTWTARTPAGGSCAPGTLTITRVIQ